VIAVTLGQMFCRAGQCERGIEQLKRTLAIYPDFTEGHEALAEIYGHQGMYAQALSELAKEPQALRKHSMVLSGYVLARAGRKQEALDVLRQVKRDELQHIYYDSAVIYLALGDKDTPIASLEKARLNHDFFMAYFRSDFKLEGLRSDPRYADLCRRMNMPQ
jgi:tetratricopeptide (TPR) repeat protein